LDTVEVVMAIEEVGWIEWTSQAHILNASQEFSIEIPDKEADAIHSGKAQELSSVVRMLLLTTSQ
jgi:hypothetical protein